MADFNGHELPELPEAVHPYATILRRDPETSDGLYFLIFSTMAAVYDTSRESPPTIFNSSEEAGQYIVMSCMAGTWTEAGIIGTVPVGGSSDLGGYGDVIWVNYDMLRPDGSIYLSTDGVSYPSLFPITRFLTGYLLHADGRPMPTCLPGVTAGAAQAGAGGMIGEEAAMVMGWLFSAKIARTRDAGNGGGMPVRADCLTFSSDDAFTIAQNDDFRNWEGSLWYSSDAESWTEWDGATVMESAAHEGSQRIYVRGSGNTRISGSSWQFIGNPWRMTGSNIRCSGNIENLLDYETVARGEHPAMEDYCFTSMFEGCTALIEAPILPATALAPFCYWGMFWGCTGLTDAPTLPANTMAKACYAHMLRNCTGLTKAPELPATTLAEQCYSSMLSGCTGLVEPPRLPATTLYTSCYASMFQNCTNLSVLPSLPATTLPNSCYYYMFAYCTSIKMSETQTDEYQYAYRIPASGEGTAGDSPFSNMFTNTGGTFTDTPEINKTYYTSNVVV